MNERIKALLIEAGIYECDDFEPHPTFEKFAELIVRECADVMINDPRLSDVRSATRGCARSIKEHFGVEE